MIGSYVRLIVLPLPVIFVLNFDSFEVIFFLKFGMFVNHVDMINIII